MATTRPTITLGNMSGLGNLKNFHSIVTKIDDALNLQGYWNYGDAVENADTILHELGAAIP